MFCLERKSTGLAVVVKSIQPTQRITATTAACQQWIQHAIPCGSALGAYYEFTTLYNLVARCILACFLLESSCETWPSLITINYSVSVPLIWSGKNNTIHLKTTAGLRDTVRPVGGSVHRTVYTRNTHGSHALNIGTTFLQRKQLVSCEQMVLK